MSATPRAALPCGCGYDPATDKDHNGARHARWARERDMRAAISEIRRVDGPRLLRKILGRGWKRGGGWKPRQRNRDALTLAIPTDVIPLGRIASGPPASRPPRRERRMRALAMLRGEAATVDLYGPPGPAQRERRRWLDRAWRLVERLLAGTSRLLRDAFLDAQPSAPAESGGDPAEDSGSCGPPDRSAGARESHSVGASRSRNTNTKEGEHAAALLVALSPQA